MRISRYDLFIPISRPPHLLDRDDISRLFVPHFDDVTARPVAEVTQQVEVVDGTLNARTIGADLRV